MVACSWERGAVATGLLHAMSGSASCALQLVLEVPARPTVAPHLRCSRCVVGCLLAAGASLHGVAVAYFGMAAWMLRSGG